MSESPKLSFEEDAFDEMDLIEPDDLPGIKQAHTFYQVMAWVVGVLLIVLTLIAMPLKYIWHYSLLVTVVGIAHGWLYALLLVAVIVLGMRVRWGWKWFLGIALAGTVPFLSFIAERKATKDVHRRIGLVKERETKC